MTAPLTGYTSSLPSDVLLDSGVLYVGATVFGAFAGGLKFDPGVTYRAADFDGKRSPVKGLDRVTMRMPKISGTYTLAYTYLLPGSTEKYLYIGNTSAYAGVSGDIGFSNVINDFLCRINT